MKVQFIKVVLLIFIVLCFSEVKAKAEFFLKYIEFKSSSNFINPYGDSDKDKKFSNSTGIKIKGEFWEVRGYRTLPNTSFKDFNAAKSINEKLSLYNDPKYGVNFNFNKIPLDIKIGHNTYSASVSRMKSPSPSTVSNPIVKSFSFITGIKASLPTLSSSNQPLSIALSTNIDNMSEKLKFCFETFTNEKNESTGTFSIRFNISRTTFIKTAFSAGKFFIENNSTILKKNNASFEADYFYTELMEFCFHSPLLKINFYSGTQESPYVKNPYWFKIDGRTFYRSLLLNFSYFAIPTSKDSPKAAPLIGGSSTICRIVEQVSFNPQVLLLFQDKNSSSIRFGFSIQENWKVTATNIPVQLKTMKLRYSNIFENNFFSLQFDWTHGDILLEGIPPLKSSRPEEYYSYALASSVSTVPVKISLSANYTRYPPLSSSDSLKESYSFNLKTAIRKINLTPQFGITNTLKDHVHYSGEVNTALTYTVKRKFFLASMKFALGIPF